MTKTSIYCYEKNGGTCRNKVSLTNNYICGAGHGNPRQSGASPSWQKVAPAINLSEMSSKRKLHLARDPSTSPEFLDGLAGDVDKYARAAVAGNSSAWPETLARLAEDKKWAVRKAVAENSSAWPETLAKLAEETDWQMVRAVAGNSSASQKTFLSVSSKGYPPYGFTREKTITGLIENIELIDQYPSAFGLAYLERLLELAVSEDETHPKRRVLIGYAYAKYAGSETDGQGKLYYKNKIKELFPNDQEMAEMIGY